MAVNDFLFQIRFPSANVFHTFRRLEEIFAANTSFAAFLGSQAQLVVWQDLNSMLSQDVHQSVVWRVYSMEGSQRVLQRLCIGLGNPL